MPELPETQRFREVIFDVAEGRRILALMHPDDTLVLVDEAHSAGKLRRELVGQYVVSSGRRGKYVWIGLATKPKTAAEKHLVFHFGMSGHVRVPEVRPLILSSSPKTRDDSFPPKFSRLVVELEAAGDRASAFAFVDGRRLGRIWLSNDPTREPPISELGPDVRDALPEVPTLAEMLRRHRGAIKSLLLDQSFLSGIGNWIADEVLFQARLDPRRAPNSLSTEEVGRLRASIANVIATAVAANADSDRYPASWLFHHRWGKSENAKTNTGDPIEFLTIGGRTTAWVPSRVPSSED